MKRKIGKSICIIMVILSVSILFGCVFWDVWLTAGWTSYGPYHHEALPLTPTKFVQVKDNYYTFFYNDIYILEKDGFERMDSDHYIIKDIQTDGEKLYVSVCGLHVSKCGIGIYSSDFEYEGLIVNEVSVESFLLHNDVIYYNGKRENKKLFFKYDIKSGTTEMLAERYLNNEIFEVDGLKIYANPRNQLYWADGQEDVNYACGYFNGQWWTFGTTYKSEQSLGFYYGEKTGIVTATEKMIQLSLGDLNIQLAQDYEMIMYPRILVSGGKLLFAAYEYKVTENCHNDFCICHVGESKLFEYDFESETINERRALNNGEYFISFDAEMFAYYSDGKIFRNENDVRNIEVMKPQGEYIVKGEEHPHQRTYVSLSVFYDDGTRIWYSFFDDSGNLESEY